MIEWEKLTKIMYGPCMAKGKIEGAQVLASVGQAHGPEREPSTIDMEIRKAHQMVIEQKEKPILQ